MTRFPQPTCHDDNGHKAAKEREVDLDSFLICALLCGGGIEKLHSVLLEQAAIGCNEVMSKQGANSRCTYLD